VDVVDGVPIALTLVAFNSVDSPQINSIELYKIVVVGDDGVPITATSAAATTNAGGATTTAAATTSSSASDPTPTTAETATSSTNPPVLTRIIGLNCGGHALTDSWGNVWISDDVAASGGTAFTTGVFVDPELYEGDLLSSER
jgi:hypothetical protein